MRIHVVFSDSAVPDVVMNPEVMARIEHARNAVPFGQVFQHYNLHWGGDQTHQYSCPFHARFRDASGRPVERNPSARFYAPDKRVWCFACQDGGDVVWFVGKVEKMRLGDAIKRTFELFGLGDIASPAVGRQIEIAARAAGEAEVRTKTITEYSDRVNDMLWGLRVVDRSGEVRQALDRIAEVIFERRLEINIRSSRIEWEDFRDRVRSWYGWAEDLIRSTWSVYSNARGAR